MASTIVLVLSTKYDKDMLEEAGWRAARACILLSKVGRTAIQHKDQAMQHLGVTRSAAHACLLRLPKDSGRKNKKLSMTRGHTVNNPYNVDAT